MVLVLVLVLVMVLLMVLVMVLVVNAPLSLLFIQSTTSLSGRGAITGDRLVLALVLVMVLVMVLVVNAHLSLLFIQSTTSSSGRGAVTGIREHKQHLIPQILSILAIWVKRAAPMLPKIRSLLTRKNLGKGCGLVWNPT